MKKRKYIDDIWERALKTFLQAFLAIAIPAIVALLNDGIQPGETLTAVLIPIFCGSLAAGISAAWNLINNWLVNKDNDTNDNN